MIHKFDLVEYGHGLISKKFRNFVEPKYLTSMHKSMQLIGLSWNEKL